MTYNKQNFDSKKKWFKIIFFFLTLFFLIILDIITGWVFNSITPESGRKNLELALSEYDGTEAILSSTVHPYMTFINTPFWEKNGIKQNNSLGYRDSENIEFKKDTNCIRILATGGSTTYGDGVGNPNDTWPEQLEKILNDSIKKYNTTYYVRVINAGLPWGVSAELLNHYIFQDRYLSPDIIIIHTGANDIQPALFNDYQADYSNWRNIKSGGKNGLRKGEGWLIRHSNIIRLLYTLWYSKLDYATSSPYISTKDFSKVETSDMRKNAISHDNSGFERNLDLLVRNIVIDSIEPVFFAFYAADLNNPECFNTILKEKDREMYEIMEIVLNKNENTAKQICDKYNVEFVKMKTGSIPPKNMVDICHLTKEGELQKAEFLYPFIIKRVEKIICSK